MPKKPSNQKIPQTKNPNKTREIFVEKDEEMVFVSHSESLQSSFG